MENNLTPYQQFQMERYGNILKEQDNPFEDEEFENGEMDMNNQIQEWHNEQMI